MADKKGKRTEIETLGEFGLIKRLTKNFKNKQKSTVKGVGDDAAVIGSGKNLSLLSTDLLIEGVHFDLAYVPFKHLGYKAVVVNVSDIYAMNGTPRQITFSIALSNRFSLEAIDELYEGIKAACKHYEVDLVGGDTSSSLESLFLSVTAVGQVQKDKISYRSGAKTGDLICVTGDLGAAYVGIQLLERENHVYLETPDVKPDLEDQDYIVGRQLKPEARKDIIRIFGENELVPTAMIDVSDGLSSDLFHICEQSKVGCLLLEDQLPIHEDTYQMALKFNIDPTMCALNGGEDYELLFTVHPSQDELVQNSPYWSIIGEITEASEGKYLISKSNKKHELTAQGWTAFEKD